jgi:transposase InsO family protein
MKSKGIILAVSGANFVKKLNKGDFCRNALNRLQINKLAIQTLIKWECLVKASDDMESPVSLLEAYRHCGRPSKFEPFVRKMIKDLSTDPRNLSPEWIYNYINDQLGIDDKELDISKRSIQLLVAGFRSDVNAMAQAQGKSVVRNNVKLHNVRINDLLPGELWESDGHKCNVLVKSPFYAYHKINKRYLVRPVVIFWWDVATGMIVGYRVCLNENKGATRNALMDSILTYGLPKSIRVDNAGSYKNVEYSPMEYYKNIKGKKRLSNDEKIAKRMIENGDMGLYKNIGLEYHFTIPGNPESKSIEAFWNYAISPFEKHFPSWCGNTFENRPEVLKKYENKVLVRKHSDMFPTWDDFCYKLDMFVRYYNGKPRKSLTTIDGTELSPIEVYNQDEHTIPNKIELITKMKYPYIEMRVVQRSIIEKNGILYWHPIFASMIGKKVGIYYDEKNLKELTICNERGQLNDEPAIAINPGLQSGDTLKEMIENHRRAKVGQLCYLSLCDLPNAQKIEKMLKVAEKELLPLSNTKEAEADIKYLNFEDALDSIIGKEDNVADIVPMSITDEPSDEDKELMESLKDDIAGMFGS